jgi:putative MATE family efflux protein
MKDFTSGNVSRQLLMFSGPLVLASIVQNMYNVVDSIIVGRFLGKEALASVGASFPVIFTLISMVIGIGSGATTVVAQYFGAKEMRNVAKTIDTIIIFFFVASVVISLAGIALSGLIFRLIGLPDELIPDAMSYMNVYLAGMFLLFMVNGIGSILRGLGDSKTPLYIVAGAAVLNILLDLIFILWFGWGVAAVAFATLLSHGIALVITIIYLNRKHPVIKISFRRIEFSRHIFRDCLRIGLPTGFQQSFVSLGMLAVMGIVTTFGTNAVAAYTAALRIDSFAKMPSFAFSSALSTFTGQNIGSENAGRIRDGLKSTLKISVMYSLAVSLIVVFSGSWLMRLFTTDADVIAIGVDYLVIVSSFYVFFTAMFAYTGLLRGAGATFIPMLITLLSLWFIRVPLSALMASYMGVNGIWWALPVSWIIGLAATWLYYFSGRWKNKGVRKKSIIPPNVKGISNSV